jgi:uncharacterized protein
MFALTPPTTGSSRTLPGLRLGQVTRLLGPNLTVTGQIDDVRRSAIGVGSLAKISGTRDIIGIINSIEIDPDSRWECLLTIALVGEIAVTPQNTAVFQRGVSHYPPLGEEVTTVTPTDLQTVYARPSVPNMRIGRLGNNELQPAFVMTDELLAKHFAVLGSTGCGKSCSVAVILSEVLEAQPNAHIILLDPHNEYSAAFGDKAQVLNVQSASLPFWLLNLEEAVRILVRGGSVDEQQAQESILKDALRQARQSYANGEAAMLTVDTPVPFPVHELTRNLREAMGQINKSETAAPYRRLETQLASLIEDRRYAFMFRDAYSADDTLSELVGSLLRIPVQGKPISIIDLSGVPSEIADVVVSVTARILFDFTLWSDPLVRPPILLACEEAHRYLPAHEGKTFAACTRAISRIAREGRKYGLSLALISQRPSELSPQALSQCGTVFALRLANDHDQAFVETALPDTGHMMMGALSSLPTQEAVVFGEAVSLPMHVRFDSLPPEKRPRSQSARFSEAWQHDEAGVDFREDAIRRWRSRCD